MASEEHLAQLIGNDDSSTSSSSSSEDDDSTSTASDGPQDGSNAMGVMAMDVEETPVSPPKKKLSIKLSLRLPTKTHQNGDATDDKKAYPSIADQNVVAAMEMDKEEVDDGDDDEEDEDEETLKATIVDEGEESDDDEMVQASVVEEDDEEAVAVAATAVPVASSTSTAQSSRKPTTTKSSSRRSPTPFSQSGRPVRLPPMSSPGLLIPPTAGVFRGDADQNGYTTPASVFNHGMFLAGYTTEGRATNPHRGSSVTRVVDDMFDSNALFTLHFPPLVPKELWNYTPHNKKVKQEGTEETGEERTETEEEAPGGETLPDMLIRALSSKPANDRTQEATTFLQENNSDTRMEDDTTPENESHKRKQRPCLTFADMAPVSLTLPYPEAYIQKRLEYVKQVEARERAIVASQEASEAADGVMEAYEEALATYNSSNAKKSNPDANENGGAEGPPVPPKPPSPIQVPPIPIPPSPPRQSEMTGIMDDSNTGESSNHPIYIPKGKEKFVSHLDKQCFHITDGRYYGLLTNNIADPHFVGPNAPGISGLNVSGGTGLATSYVGSSSSGGAGSSQAYYGGSVGGGSSGAGGGGGGGGSSKDVGGDGSTKAGTTKKTSSSSPGGSSGQASRGASSKGPAPTSNSTELKKIMEQGDDDLVEQMRVCIIRAAVYASRTGVHGGSFVLPNGETYPDVSKAFAAHAGLRPCNRCKNNKQGAYHCRLRRKHKDSDYDGGNSWGVLSPLFEEPLEDLLLK